MNSEHTNPPAQLEFLCKRKPSGVIKNNDKVMQAPSRQHWNIVSSSYNVAQQHLLFLISLNPWWLPTATNEACIPFCQPSENPRPSVPCAQLFEAGCFGLSGCYPRLPLRGPIFPCPIIFLPPPSLFQMTVPLQGVLENGCVGQCEVSDSIRRVLSDLIAGSTVLLKAAVLCLSF